MFALFFNLYLALFRGEWFNYNLTNIQNMLKPAFNGLGEFLTSLFNNVDTPMTTLGDIIMANSGNVQIYHALFAFVLASITSIGIVVMAVKGVKKAFGIFFGHIR